MVVQGYRLLAQIFSVAVEERMAAHRQIASWHLIAQAQMVAAIINRLSSIARLPIIRLSSVAAHLTASRKIAQFITIWAATIIAHPPITH